MRLASMRAGAWTVPFQVAFRHASAERSRMQSVWVEVRSTDGVTGIGEGCPREYVTGESLASALAFCERHRSEWMAGIADVDSLAAWVERHASVIDANPAAWGAVELAVLDCLGKSAGVPVETLLGLPSLAGRYRYSAVLGDAADDAFRRQLHAYRKRGFDDYKIKLSGNLDHDRTKVAAIAEIGIPAANVRADANNAFPDVETAAAHLSALGDVFGAIEEPLQAHDRAGLNALASRISMPIVLDESVLRIGHLEALRATPASWIVNVRVSKMGGLLRATALVRRARELALRLVVGAHVGESSVLTRAGLTLADLAGDSLVAHEGGFGTHLLARDPVTPCLMFGAGGVMRIEPAGPARAGLGLSVAE